MFCYFCMKETFEQNGCCASCGKSFAKDPDRNHLLPGTILKGKYMVGNVLGQGGFGITYAGKDTTLDIRIAIKEYYPAGHASRDSLSSNDVTLLTGPNESYFANGKQRFLTEAKALAKFNRSGNIVHARDYFELNNTAYIIMDFVEGKDLKHFLRENGRVEPQRLVDWFMPILSVLGKVHAEGLIHRDISPDNIIVENGDLILIDFGAARDVDADKSLSVMLKPGYAPGEQYTSDRSQQGPWTDIYAVCATMYECITGVTPQESSSRLFEDHLQKPSELGIAIPPHIEAALMHGMANKYKDRPQNMQQLIAELTGAVTPVLPVAASVDDPKTVLMDDPKTVLMQQPAYPNPADTQLTGVEIGHLTTGIPQQTGEMTKAIAAAPERAGRKKFIVAVAAICLLVLVGGITATAALSRKSSKDSDLTAESEITTSETITQTVEEAAAAGTEESTEESTGTTSAVKGKAKTTTVTTGTTVSTKKSKTTSTEEDSDDTTKKPRTTRHPDPDDPPSAYVNPNRDPDPPSPQPTTPSKTTTEPKKTTTTPKKTTTTTRKTTTKPATTTTIRTTKPTDPPPPPTTTREPSDYYYEDINGGVRINGIKTDARNLNIPEFLNGQPVIEIADYAFQKKTNIESVSLPDTLRTIGEGAFEGLSNLREIYIPDSVTAIYQSAFSYCGLQKVRLSRNTKVLNDKAFYRNESLSSVIIPEGVENIGDDVFAFCDSLELVYIPVSISHIGVHAFSGYNSAMTFYLYYGSSDGEWGTKDISDTAFDFEPMKSDFTTLHADERELGYQ